VVDVERIIGENDFSDRIEKFTKAGITFGSNPNLFKVISEGMFNRSTYTLVAYVYMPKQETSAPPLKKEGETEADYQKRIAAETNRPAQLFEPRIIELQIN